MGEKIKKGVIEYGIKKFEIFLKLRWLIVPQAKVQIQRVYIYQEKAYGNACPNKEMSVPLGLD